MRLLQSYLLLAAMLPGLAMGLGLGKLQSNSALNEPFSARIDLVSPTVEELDSLKVILADPEAFRRAGILRPHVLSKLRFSIKQTESGPDYIHISTDDPIREPYLNFLIEVSWSNGRLFREYTVLLDPPIYSGVRSQKKLSSAKTQSATRIESDIDVLEDNKVVYNPEYKPTPSPVSTTRPTAPVSRPIDYSGGDYGPVISGDTLWSIASAMRPDTSVSVQQMMLALLRANPEAFINNNINGLKRGHVLQMPDLSAIQSTSKDDAFSEARLQNNLWAEARGALAETVTQRPESTAVVQEEKPSVPEPDSRPVIPDQVEEDPELRLVAPSEEGEVGEQDGKATSQALSQELALANESLEALKLENIELRDKLSETEAIIDDLNRLIVLKETELAELQQQIATAKLQAEEKAKAEAQAKKAEAMKAEQETARKAAAEKESKPAEKPVKPAPEKTVDSSADEQAAKPEPVADTGLLSYVPDSLKGIVSSLKDYLLYIAAAIVALLLVIIGAVFVKRRREGATTEIPQSAFADFDDMDVGAEDATDMNPALDESEDETLMPGDDETVMQEAENEELSPDAEGNDATQIVSPPAEAAAAEPEQDEEEDPLAEVNVFLAYEHFDQAEEFVKNALEKQPDNLEFHTKLLEVHYAANNRKGYEEAAKVLHEKVGGEGDYWNMAVAMWQEMSPNRELFAEPLEDEEEAAPAETEGGGMLNIAGDDSGEEQGLDLDFGAEGAEEEDEDLDISKGGADDADVLDVTAAIDIDDDSELAEVTGAADSEELDLDEDILDVSAGVDEDMDGSLDGDDEAAATESAEDDNALDFSLDMAEDATVEKSVEDALEMSLDTPANDEEEPASDSDGGLDFSLDTSDSDEEPEAADDDSLDMSFDITGDEAEDSEAEMEAAESNDDDALDFSLDTGDDAEAGQEADDDTDISLDMSDSGTEEESTDDDALDFSLDLEDTGQEEAESAANEALGMPLELDDDDQAEGSVNSDDALDVTKDAADDDLLDVTKTTDIDIDNDEDLLDVTSSVTAAGMDTDEIIDSPKYVETPEEDTDSDNEMDFELSPDDSESIDPGDATFIGLDDGSESDEDSLDFNLDSGEEPEKVEPEMDLDMDATMEIPSRGKLDDKEESVEDEDEDDENDHTIMVPRSSDTAEQSEEDEIASQLDLAKAYVELGDVENAKTILNEVIAIGNDEQKQQAEELLGQL